MATPKDILAEIRTVVEGVTGIARVNSSRKTDEIASGQYSASVLYRGESIELWVINSVNDRDDHTLPVAIEIRTTRNTDDDLIDKVYSVLDAVLLPANKPTEVTWIKPEGIDEPEGEDILSTRINVNVRFRRTPSFVDAFRITDIGDQRVTANGDTRISRVR